ncbi:conjugal transfer protein [Aeromonas veronii]|uniref:conjugal transfer protein n=1 Tax=Aeromonas veronii TaxID=654 RepID=UPI001C5A5C59|nr:conjugal transfer protein [Aeromonas veronii]MBW3779591.1 conjugal transfer protein [Aeromonas veronii]
MYSRIIIPPLLFVALFAGMPARAADPCEVVICMMGKVTGQSGGDACKDAIRSFFDIREFGRKGRFSPAQTANARKGMLGQCKAARPREINQIISKFGRVFG